MSEKKRIIVIKIGSSVIMTKRNKLDEFRLCHIADQIIAMQNKGMAILLVVSGAVACGANFVDIANDRNIRRQAAAGIGQAYLISRLLKIFEQKNLQMAQILLTKNDFKLERVRNNLSEMIDFYMQSKIIPIFNENDVLEMNSFGGNDFLAAEITMLLKADQLLILSTQEGSTYGVGGGATKLEALELLRQKQIRGKIVDGKEKDIIFKSIL